MFQVYHISKSTFVVQILSCVPKCVSSGREKNTVENILIQRKLDICLWFILQEHNQGYKYANINIIFKIYPLQKCLNLCVIIHTVT